MHKRLILILLGLFVLLIASWQTIHTTFAANTPPDLQQASSTSIAFLTGPNNGDPADIAVAYLRQNAARLGLTAADLADVVLKDRYVTRHNGVTHLYYRQRHSGIELYNGDININIARDGAVIGLGNRFVADLAGRANTTTPVYHADSALERAASDLKLSLSEPLKIVAASGGPDQAVTLSSGGITSDGIPAQLMYFRQPDGAVRLAWQAVIDQADGRHVWNVAVDAVTGTLIQKVDLVLDSHGAPLQSASEQADPGGAASAGQILEDEAEDVATTAQPPSPLTPPTYRVFPLPLEHPEDGVGLPDSQVLLNNPADALASPFGWHDIDALPGHEFLDTRGNNVWAQEDRNGDDFEGFRPTGVRPRRFNFDYAFNPSLEPPVEPNQSAAIVNLFYWNNILHDIAYQYGFDEVSGNFQQNNYERGGIGDDPVQADAQDGFDFGAVNNANFYTPPDGFPPRMQMYVFTFTSPNRDSDLDNGIIAHEYMHGISNRLVGGPFNTFCLFNYESMGEGWSDFLTLALTVKTTDTGDRPRPVGTYVLGQPADGPGIRRVPYSTDMRIDPQTYDWLKRSAETHDVGEVWATMLWDLHWALVEQYGFDPDLYNGTGGNNLALQLVMDGMKFAPCEPGFVDARDAILIADLVNNGGANQCTIWASFARRGLGLSADQGSPWDAFDGREAFDLPPDCRDDLSLTKSGTPPEVEAGGELTFELVATNYTSQTLTGVTLSDPIPASTTYVPDSASDGGSEAGGVITWQLSDLNPDESAVRTFAVTVNRDFPDVAEVFFDDMESGPDQWVADGLWRWQDDSEPCGRSASPTHSWYYGDPFSCTYPDDTFGRLTTAAPIALPAGKVTLTFQSWEEAESCCDPRTVLVSTDGVNFVTVWRSNSNIIANWYEAVVDLSAYSGQSIWLSFEFSSDFSVFFTGWYVDDVRITVAPGVENVATLTTNEGLTVDARSINQVVRLPHIAVEPPAFEETLQVGEKVERTLTINNTGTAPLRFTILVRDAPAATDPAAQTASAAPMAFPPDRPAAQGRVSYAGEHAQARVAALPQPKAGALLSAEAPNVLLLAAADAFQMQAILQAYGDLGQVDIFDARFGTPALEELLFYQTVVVIANNAFADPVAVGDLLAAYVDSGGTVVQTVPTFFDPFQNGWGLRGRWLDEGYSPLTGTGDWFQFASLGEFDATHPIMQGVDEAGDFLRQVMELAPGANLVASWTDDEFVATRGSVVALNTFVADGYGWSGDVDLIVHNSIVWLQSQRGSPVNWLSVTPDQGEVSPDGSQTVQVTIDAGAAGIVSGDYTAALRIISNAPEARILDIPVTLHARGPELSLSDESAGWYGRPVTMPVSFTGNGFEIAAATFSLDMDESCLRIDPTDSDGNGVPDAVSFSLPAGFQGMASIDPTDSDGEVDIFIADLQPPLAALPDGVLATVAFRPTCLPADGPLTVGVNFSTAPSASVSDLNGVTIPTATKDGLITVEPGAPGDCNQDGKVDAGDTISCVLEIFDGDGDFWQDAPSGTFAGSPQGCDSNQDNLIDAADIICTVLIIFQGQGACEQAVVAASASPPAAASLSVADGIRIATGAATAVPIYLNTNGNAVAAAAFTITYDPALLHLDASDANGDGLPDALHFSVPGDFVKSAKLTAPGRIQVLLADMALPLATLPDGVLATLHLTADAAADGQTAAIGFAAPSLGSASGRRVPLVAEAGSVLIGEEEMDDDAPVEEAPVDEAPDEESQHRIYLPNVSG
jgi:uncharacterized repeat protein (TIGR01451 family)